MNKKVQSKNYAHKPTVYFLLASAFIALCSHDLYLKMETYFLSPHQDATLSLYNGTFENSENIISRDRMLDASIVAQGQRKTIDSSQWQDQDSTITQLTFNTAEAGTYVVGVSTKARNIALSAVDFNSYLEHDGVLDVLEQRTQDNALNQDAVESYEKHVKAIYQVGNKKTDDWNVELGYPIEFVPQANPYSKYSGEQLEIQLILEGQPLPNQLVYADYIKNTKSNKHEHEHHGHEHNEHKHSHSSDEAHTHVSGQQLRTNDQGIITVDLPEDGIYYVRTIHMTKVNDHDELTHRSKWATLTFEVSHKHGEDTHTHDSTDGIPTWVFILASLAVIVILFLAFRQKDS